MKDSAFTTVKRDSNEYHLSMKGIRTGYIFNQKWYIKGKAMDLGADFPRIKFC